MKAGERVAIVLASTLDLSGASDDGTYNPSTGRSLADNYDYVMHGRVFEIKHIDALRIEIQASFGGEIYKLINYKFNILQLFYNIYLFFLGLLLRAIGDQAQFDNIVYDMNFFILMRKGGSDSSMITD